MGWQAWPVDGAGHDNDENWDEEWIPGFYSISTTCLRFSHLLWRWWSKCAIWVASGIGCNYYTRVIRGLKLGLVRRRSSFWCVLMDSGWWLCYGLVYSGVGVAYGVKGLQMNAKLQIFIILGITSPFEFFPRSRWSNMARFVYGSCCIHVIRYLRLPSRAHIERNSRTARRKFFKVSDIWFFLHLYMVTGVRAGLRCSRVRGRESYG